MQTAQAAELLTADAVEALLGVDKSTVYRMAQDGRLLALKVGRQWRFPASPIRELLDGIGITSSGPLRAAPPEPVAAPAAQPVIDLAASLLGVMMVVTDMDGAPVTEVANPCAWYDERRSDPAVLAECVAEWRALAAEDGFEPQFRVGHHGFECARALIRDGNRLVGMVLAGGVAPASSAVGRPDLHILDADQRDAVLAALPVVASTVARVSSTRIASPIARS